MAESILRFSPPTLERLRQEVPSVAEQVVTAVMDAVPAYADPFRGRLGKTIEGAVRAALEGFIDLAARPQGMMTGSQVEVVYRAAYDLGRGEARSGRSMDALAQAYRVGARVAWQDLSRAAVQDGLAAEDMARFAELVFAYIDELSDMSVRGHVDELASTGQLQLRRRERLFTLLLADEPLDVLLDAADRANWTPPPHLVAVVLTEDELRGVRAGLDDDTLTPGQEVPGLEQAGDLTVVLVPTRNKSARDRLVKALADTGATIGPLRPWQQVSASYRRALQARQTGRSGDTDAHLVELVLGADAEALEDLRTRALAPLAGLSPGSRTKLTETLRAWLLHHGRRDEIATALYVHPQTVRYRVGQLRELFGDRLTDPTSILELTVALGPTTPAELAQTGSGSGQRGLRLTPWPARSPG
ncbi:MAG: helix-turn-helix domain-containing protein [Nocardioidaceae bacterium]